MTAIKLTDGTLTIEISGLTAIHIDRARHVIAVDGISGTTDPTDSEDRTDSESGWTVVDLRDGTYGDFHRLHSAEECFDPSGCAALGQHELSASPAGAPS